MRLRGCDVGVCGVGVCGVGGVTWGVWLGGEECGSVGAWPGMCVLGCGGGVGGGPGVAWWGVTRGTSGCNFKGVTWVVWLGGL